MNRPFTAPVPNVSTGCVAPAASGFNYYRALRQRSSTIHLGFAMVRQPLTLRIVRLKNGEKPMLKTLAAIGFGTALMLCPVIASAQTAASPAATPNVAPSSSASAAKEMQNMDTKHHHHHHHVIHHHVIHHHHKPMKKMDAPMAAPDAAPAK
jgi:hypothetical protein